MIFCICSDTDDEKSKKGKGKGKDDEEKVDMVPFGQYVSQVQSYILYLYRICNDKIHLQPTGPL